MMSQPIRETNDEQLRSMIRNVDPRPVFARFAEMVATHVQSQSLFSQAPYNANSPLHDLTRVSFPPKPSSLHEVRSLAAIATPERERIAQVFRSRPDQINELYNHARDGQPVFVFMAHDDITDIGRVLPEVLVTVCEYHADLVAGSQARGSDAWDAAAERMYREVVQKFHIILSSTLRLVVALGVPVADLLANVGWVHFSFPATDTTREAGLPVELVQASNRLMRSELDALLEADGGVVGLAGPGSVDKRRPLGRLMDYLNYLPERYRDRFATMRHIQPIHSGTARLLEGRYVLPVAAKIHEPRAFVETGRLQRVRGIDDLHAIMDWIADTCHSRSLEATVYHRTPEDFRRFWQWWRRDSTRE